MIYVSERQRVVISNNYIGFYPQSRLCEWKWVIKCDQIFSQNYNGQSLKTRSFWNQIILEIFLSSDIPVSNISSWDWYLIDCTINLILWDKPPCILPPMSNKGWTAIYHWIWPITPPFTVVPTEGTVCVLQLACDRWGAGRPRPPDHLHLFLAKAGMARGWWNVCSTDRFWHLALVIFVTKCPPAYGMGQDCHNLAKQSSSEYSCCVTLCHLWQQRLANNCYMLSVHKAFNLYCCEMLYFFQGWTFYSILHQLLSQPHNQQ